MSYGRQDNILVDFLRENARARYAERHGDKPPADFLSEFAFYVDGEPKDPDAMSYRRLLNIGLPRTMDHPYIKKGLIKKGGTLVDAGCGAGDDSRWFQENGYADKIFGIDIKPVAFELGYAFYEDRGAAGCPLFIKADVRKMPFGQDSADNVYSGSLIHTMETANSVGAFVDDAWRILKPGGAFFGNTLGTDDPESKQAFPLKLSQSSLMNLISGPFKIEEFCVTPITNNCPDFRLYFVALKK